MVTMPISSVELQEYLFAQTLLNVASKCEAEKRNVTDYRELAIEIRKSFRYQRFAVINWLLMNGVSIPAELLTDQTHPQVGNQFPDKQV